jgi:4-amino-4-deoxy-L-arabinose transferase-like glycosyltransferase
MNTVSTPLHEAPAARWWQRPWLIVGAGLALRLTWAALVPIEPISDSVLYEGFARSIASGRGYAYPDGGPLTVYWPVGAPAVYAALFALFGAGRGAIAVFQALLGAAIVGLTWRIAARLLDRRAAACAAWFVAVWPLLVEFTTIMASELLFIALLLAALDAWTSRSGSVLRRAVLWGACIAGATYVRPTAWPLLAIFPLLAFALDRRWRPLFATLAASTLTAALLFAPWVHRNYGLFGQFVLVAANGGTNLWMGNNPASNGGYMALPPTPDLNEAERDRHFGRAAVDFIKAEPAAYLRLSWRRAVMTYDRESIGVAWNETGLVSRFGAASLLPIKALSSAYWLAMLVLGGAGVVRLLRARMGRAAWPLLAALAFFAVVPILTVAQDRYHVPIDPLLAIFAAVAVSGLPRRAGAPPAAVDHA